MSDFMQVGFVSMTSSTVSYMQREALRKLDEYMKDREKFFSVMEKLSYQERNVWKHSFLGFEFGEKTVVKQYIQGCQNKWFRNFSKAERNKLEKDRECLVLLDTSGLSTEIYVSLEAKSILDKWFNVKEEPFQEWYANFKSYTHYLHGAFYPSLEDAIEEYKKC